MKRFIFGVVMLLLAGLLFGQQNTKLVGDFTNASGVKITLLALESDIVVMRFNNCHIVFDETSISEFNYISETLLQLEQVVAKNNTVNWGIQAGAMVPQSPSASRLYFYAGVRANEPTSLSYTISYAFTPFPSVVLSLTPTELKNLVASFKDALVWSSEVKDSRMNYNKVVRQLRKNL